MLDIKLIRTNPEIVKENIKKKFQEEKLALVDKVVELDKRYREIKVECDNLRNQRKTKSKEIGGLMSKGLKDDAEKIKSEVGEIGKKLAELEELEVKMEGEIREIMLVIPNIIDESVPIGTLSSIILGITSIISLISPSIFTSSSSSSASFLPISPTSDFIFSASSFSPLDISPPISLLFVFR